MSKIGFENNIRAFFLENIFKALEKLGKLSYNIFNAKGRTSKGEVRSFFIDIEKELWKRGFLNG